jgi:hypothetical protein
MPVAAHIDPDSRIVMFRCSGHVAISEARRAFDHMMTDPAVVGNASALWDLRGAAIGERPRSIPDIMDMLQHRHPGRIGGSRIAILVPEEHGPGVSTVVEKNAASESFKVRVFSSYWNAARWLAGEEL